MNPPIPQADGLAWPTLGSAVGGAPFALAGAADLELIDAATAATHRMSEAVLAQMDEAVIACDRDGNVVYLNPAAEARYGQSAAAVLGRPRSRLYTEHGLPADADADAAGHGPQTAPRIVRCVHRRADGQQWPAEASVSTLFDAHGQPSGELAVVRDVGERLRSEHRLAEAVRELQRRERQFATLADNLPDATARFDRQGRHLYVNRAIERLTGVPADAFIGRTSAELGVPPERCAAWSAALDSVFATGLPQRVSFDFTDVTGRTRSYVTRLTPEFGDDGRSVESVLAVSSDETERVRLDRARDAVEAALRDADRRKNEFIATLSHELRTPLGAIVQALQVLQRAPERSAGGSARQTLQRQVDLLVRLVDDLLDVHRIGQGKLRLRRETVDLVAVVGSALESVRPQIDAAGHRLELQLPPPATLVVDGDAQRLAQALANLLANAAKYTPPGGTISVAATRRPDGHVVVSVTDTGVGITREMLPRIFELFAQAEPGRDGGRGGLGIGLALVRHLAELHGGSVHAASDGPGRGSRFELHLPASRAPAAAAAPRRDGDGDRSRAHAATSVLVVDDNVDSADSLAELLRLAGHTVLVAHDADAALHMAAAHPPHAALLDIGLPGMDGRALARRLRAGTGGRQMLLIALSGWGGDEDRERSLSAGFDHHLVKPASIDTLLSLLAQALR